MRILLVEDDPSLAAGIRLALKPEHFTVDHLSDGVTALAALKEGEPFDAVILDLGLPRMDGMQVLEAVRRQGNRVPILVLTARDAVDERIAGLDAGADDYLTKPFHVEELIARCNALIRRSAGKANPEMTAGPIKIHTRSQQVWVNDKELSLTAYEYKVLEYLMVNPQKVISKSELTEHIYDQDFDLDSNVIEVFVLRLRKKLDPEGTLNPVETLRGRGYRLKSQW